MRAASPTGAWLHELPALPPADLSLWFAAYVQIILMLSSLLLHLLCCSP